MKRIYLHPIPVRIWHWINAISFLTLIITGIQIRYHDFINLMSFETAVDIHNWFGFILIGNYLIWLIFYISTGKIKIYIPSLNKPIEFIKGMLRQARYYGFGIFMGEPNPHHATPDNKFNPMQKMAYLFIMVLLIPLQLITGLLLWDVTLFSRWINLLGGIKIVDIIHVLLFIFFTSFLFFYFYLATLGPTPLAHIKAMITGYEELEEEHSH